MVQSRRSWLFSSIFMLIALQVFSPFAADTPAKFVGPRQISRSTSAAPPAAVADLAFDPHDAQALTWTFYLNGDYDQNGEVNSADIVPIAQYYGKTSSNLDWPAARVADGDGNGEVNQADMVAIAQSFGSNLTGFVLYAADNPVGPFEPQLLGNIDFYAEPVPAAGGPRQFSHQIAYPVVGKYYSVVAYDGDSPAEVHSNVVQFNPTGNIPPLASFALETTGERMTGVLAVAHADASSDPDGTIVKFEWDFLGDGNWMSTGTEANIDFQITEPGEYAPTLRVTDDGGATSTTTFPEPQIFVTNGVVHKQVLDSDSEAGLELSCAVVDGQPAVAYMKYGGESQLRYLRAAGTGTPVWPSPQQVDQDCGQPALANLAGVPVIAYSKDELNYIYANDAAGTSWSTSIIIAADPAPLARRGYKPDISVDVGLPTIADSTSNLALPGNVFVSQANDNQGSAWGAETQISSAGTTGLQPTLATFGSSFVSVVYQRYINPDTYDIYYQSSLTGDTSFGWYALTQVTGENARLSHDCSMVGPQWVDTYEYLPLIVFWNPDSGMLRSITCNDRATVGTTQFRDIASSSGTYSNYSLALIQGQPAVVWYDSSTQELKLCWAANRRGLGWGEPVVLDSGADLINPALIEYNQWPAVAYYDADAAVLKFLYVAPQ